MSLTVLEQLALALLGGAVLLSLCRLLIGPTAADRVVAADILATIATSGLVVIAALFASPLYLDVALVYGVLAFLGIVAMARAIEANR